MWEEQKRLRLKIEKAYSLEANEIIDPELAYDYYWHGKITNKQAFECPSDNCTASITCANMDKTRIQMKVNPYYRTVGKHSPDCHLLLETEILKTKSKITSGFAKERSQTNLDTDLFITTRPDSHFEKKKKVKGNRDFVSEMKRNRLDTRKYVTTKRANPHYALAGLVSKYLVYKEKNLTQQRYINIKGYDVSYEEMFIPIARNNVDDLPKYKRVYYGEAFVNEIRSTNAYSVKFKEEMLIDDELMRPSIYISEEVLKNAFTKNLMFEKIKAISKTEYPVAMIYAYASPPIKNVKKKDGVDKEYLNMYVNDMDCFDLREL